MGRARDLGRGYTRRRALTAIGGAGFSGAGIALGGAKTTWAGDAPPAGPRETDDDDDDDEGGAPSCVLSPHVDEGPFYLPLETVRGDIREDRVGVPLLFRFRVLNVKTCQPLSNAAVDLWHCDAAGIYAGYEALTGGLPPRENPDGGVAPGRVFAHIEPVNDESFLRGVQLTNQRGIAELQSIYPGWYQGRTLHIHLKVHVGGSVDRSTYTGGHVSHTGQLYLPEEVTARIATIEPYASNTVSRVTNETDPLYKQTGLSGEFKVRARRARRGAHQPQLVASIVLGLDPDAID